MKVQIYNTYEEMSSAAADLVAAQLRLKPASHLGLTAGSTPIGMFAALTELYKNHHVSFADCWFYNLEEMVLPLIPVPVGIISTAILSIRRMPSQNG